MPTCPSLRGSRTPPDAANGRVSFSAAFDTMGRRPRQPLRRPAQPLTWVLANHAKAFLEAQQYASGFTFLNTLLTAGTSISTPAKPYRAFLAPAAQLALAATIVVYPSVTTKAKLPDDIKGADAAVRYLRTVHTTIEPVDKTLRDAFAFGERSTRHGHRTDGPSAEAANNMERLTGNPATEQSLWERAEDFWHVVGWAFNCSRAHKKRWERWTLWLDLMLDFLEADWETRMRLGKEEGADREQMLLDSLLWHHITSEGPTSRTNRTRMIRAIFAMASADSNKEFPEIWKGETLERKPRSDDSLRPITKVDDEDGEWGDIRSDDEDVVMKDTEDDAPMQTSPASRRSSSSSVISIFDSQSPADRLGGIDAINQRQRFLALLCQVAAQLPSHFSDPGSFYDSSIADVFLKLPTGVFSLVLSTSKLSGTEQTALHSNLLFPLVTAKIPNYALNCPIQSDFEHVILPVRATTPTYEKNAKISFILEQMFMYMMTAKLLQPTDGLRVAVESGINARKTWKSKKGSTNEEEHAKTMMEASARRLLGLLEVLEVAAGMQPQERERRNRPSPTLLTSFGSLSSPPTDLSSP